MVNLSVLPLFLCLSCLSAQRTWVVDINNGPGTDFTNLPPAVAAAVDGDIIRIRAGSYAATTTGKAITLLGEGSASSQVAVQSLTLTGLASGSELVVKRLTTLSLQVEACSGRVHFDSVTSAPFLLFVTSVANCRLVTFNNCVLANPYFSTSTLTLAGCTISSFIDGQPACRMTQCRAEISHSQISGYNASCTFCMLLPTSGMVLSNSQIILAGESAVRAGREDPLCFSRPPTPGIDANATSSVHLDPGVTVTSAFNAPPVRGVVPTIAMQAGLRATAQAPGGLLTTELTAPAGLPAAVFVSLSSLDQVYPFGRVWLDLPTAFVLQTAAMPGNGKLTNNVIIGLGYPRGLSLCLQGLVVPGPLHLSTPAIVVLH